MSATNRIQEALALIRSDDLGERLTGAGFLARMHLFGSLNVACTAAETLAERRNLEQVILCLGNDVDPNTRLLAAGTIFFLRKEAVPHLDLIASFMERYPTETLLALVAIGEPAEPQVLRALRHEKEQVRLTTLKILDTGFEWPSPVTERETRAVLEMTADPSEAIAEAAWATLDTLAAGHRAVRELLESLAAGLTSSARARLMEIIETYRNNED